MSINLGVMKTQTPQMGLNSSIFLSSKAFYGHAMFIGGKRNDCLIILYLENKVLSLCIHVII